MPLPDKFRTRLTPFEVKEFFTGTNAKQQPYTIYQVRARKQDGQEITAFPLRSFENLKLHEEIDVECKLYDGGAQYGVSYTIKRLTGAKPGGADAERVAHLEKQMREVFDRLGMSYLPVPEPAQASAPPPAPPAAPAGPPTAPPPPAPTPISAPPVPPPNPPTQVGVSQPVQPEPRGGQFGEDPPF